MERNREFRRNNTTRLILGIVFVFLGIAVLGEIAGIFDWDFKHAIFSWPMILIFLGVVFISGKDSKSTGLILLGIGIFFIIPRFFDTPYYWRSLFWPIVLITLGVLIIFHRGKRPVIPRSSSSGEDILDDTSIFGGSDRLLNSQNFKGGKITNIFGGSKYDMRQVKLAEGTNYLEVSMIFGGSKFIVPENWDIKLEVTSIFGGFSDKRMRSIVVPDENRRLIITGEAIFGGGELTNI